ncbi:MAG TPA: NADH-quinone oxidoreductase subunit C, partial [Egibacteraceae bacterium]|nr:NADH-quinone oxidoreductase subunit C [Egibacteraceae bacterium]
MSDDARPDAGDKAGTSSGNPDMAAGEAAALREKAIAERSQGGQDLGEAGIAVQLSEQLAALRDRITAAFDGLEVLGFRGELTLVASPAQIIDLLTFCRDDPEVGCELLADLSGVHWPAGKRVEAAQETTGWPAYEFGDEVGRIELDYILYSITHNHRLRIRVDLPDEDPTIASAASVYGSANFMEREAYDFFGVVFSGHPNLTRIHMPEDWVGHPHRKD